jgi:hypothetical protein
MRDPFPPEHERRITFRAHVAAPMPASSRPAPARPASSIPPPGRRKSMPSFAEIDVVEANLANDPRVDRD